MYRSHLFIAIKINQKIHKKKKTKKNAVSTKKNNFE